ncbi:MAG: Na+/H+ antiporter NhaA [Betaproteobacteria bacterium]
MRALEAISEFLRLEAAGGIILVVAAAAAMLLANSPWHAAYTSVLEIPVAVQLGTFAIAKPLLLWINDGFMAIFFLLVGLELKREVLEGELSKPSQIALPALCAVGGMIVPAGLYVWITIAEPAARSGWAIPTATDIAFAVGVLALLGNRVPAALKVFLLTLAIVDDLGAIIIIAIFYSDQISILSLAVAAGAIVSLLTLNLAGVRRITPYVLVGIVLWAAVLKSGIHATLSGVVLAAFIPLGKRTVATTSPLERLEHDLHPWVAYAILPVFAFANSGVSLLGASLVNLLQPVPLGIAVGLFFGKQVGVFGFAWLAIKTRLARLPDQVSWAQLYGAALLCGIGFTMSLFINSLALDQGALASIGDGRIGIILGSLASALAGYFVLRGRQNNV